MLPLLFPYYLLFKSLSVLIFPGPTDISSAVTLHEIMERLHVKDMGMDFTRVFISVPPLKRIVVRYM